jgi:hypothetical protein
MASRHFVLIIMRTVTPVCPETFWAVLDGRGRIPDGAEMTESQGRMAFTLKVRFTEFKQFEARK